MFKMAWYDCAGPDATCPNVTKGAPWHEYVVDDAEAMAVAKREILLAWDGELARWTMERFGEPPYPSDTCLGLVEKSIRERSPIGFTVYFIKNAFRLEPVNA